MPVPRTTAAALWTEPAPPRQFITRAQLVREALARLDEAGFEELTMRRLAERLGVKSASLYNHVRDKHELLTLMADAICADVPTPAKDQSWRDQLEATAVNYRRVLLSHRDAARVLSVTPPLGPNRLRLIEDVLAVLYRGGFNGVQAADLANLFNTFVTGFVLDETQALPGSDLPDKELTDRAAQVEQVFRSLPADRYPTVVGLTDALLDANMDRRFNLGLQAFLTGLEVLKA